MVVIVDPTILTGGEERRKNPSIAMITTITNCVRTRTEEFFRLLIERYYRKKRSGVEDASETLSRTLRVLAFAPESSSVFELVFFSQCVYVLIVTVHIRVYGNG